MNIEHFPEKKVFQTVVDGETARLMYHVARRCFGCAPHGLRPR